MKYVGDYMHGKDSRRSFFFTWGAFGVVCGSPSLTLLIQTLFIDYEFSAVINAFLDGYKVVLTGLNLIVSPFVKALSWIASTFFGYEITFYEYWANLFVISSILFASIFRGTLTITKRTNELSLAFTIYLISFLGCFCAGFIAPNSSNFTQGIFAFLPIGGIVAAYIVFSSIWTIFRLFGRLSGVYADLANENRKKAVIQREDQSAELEARIDAKIRTFERRISALKDDTASSAKLILAAVLLSTTFVGVLSLISRGLSNVEGLRNSPGVILVALQLFIIGGLYWFLSEVESRSVEDRVSMRHFSLMILGGFSGVLIIFGLDNLLVWLAGHE